MLFTLSVIAVKVLSLLLVSLPAYSYGTDSPIVGQPALEREASVPCAVVTIVDNVKLSQYYQVESLRYRPPSSCPGPWSQVILEMRGEVAGVQFDRAGGIWFDGVEILRTTTPEPYADGLRWGVEKDVTLYSELFMRRNATVDICIPNIVTQVYTGVLNINATLSFYPQNDESSSSVNNLPVIRNLLNVGNNTTPWEAIALRGEQAHTRMITFSHSNMISGFVDVYASAHGNEEFWYTNPPDSIASQYQMPGGGSYREIQMFIDGILAGATYAFPVVYTGGFNPLLWKPLTGILSFDIPAYRFDITPFIGALNDGQAHNFTFVVVGNEPKGAWNIDPVLGVYLHNDDKAVIRGRILKWYDEGPSVATSITNSTMEYLIETRGNHRYGVVGEIVVQTGLLGKGKGKGKYQIASVNANINSLNYVTIPKDGSKQTSHGSLNGTTSSSGLAKRAFSNSTKRFGEHFFISIRCLNKLSGE